MVEVKELGRRKVEIEGEGEVEEVRPLQKLRARLPAALTHCTAPHRMEYEHPAGTRQQCRLFNISHVFMTSITALHGCQLGQVLTGRGSSREIGSGMSTTHYAHDSFIDIVSCCMIW